MFDRRRNGDFRANVVVGWYRAFGAVFSVGVESDQEKRRCCAREFMRRAVFDERGERDDGGDGVWPDHPNEIAMTTKESGGVRLFSKVLSSFASNNNNNNNSSASDVTTWKIERLPNDETETAVGFGGVGRDRREHSR